MKFIKTGLIYIFLLIGSFTDAQQLVLRGDYPDPSVVRIGDSYWATATTSNWAPVYPILTSKDLVNWTTVTHAFQDPPAWADYYFWAPELSYENGKVYLYYAAHKKDGNLCIAVASADHPGGPYTDHGPLMCQPVGSIDAFAMRDENGKLYMIWKEDGNSVNKPTPVWAMEMNEERTKLIGEKKELFRNDATWEANLVEGVSMMRHGEYFYAFYAAAGCCGKGCTYTSGIARSKSLLGPWEKYSLNPVLKDDEEWLCPGHGTPVEKDGRYYYMYHAYDKENNVYTGREGLIMEFRFTPNGWIEFIKDNEPDVTLEDHRNNFRGRELNGQWQWSVFNKPQFNLRGGALHLSASPAVTGSFLGHKTVSADYTATAKLHIKRSGASPGLAVMGDDNNMIMAIYTEGVIRLVQVRDGKETILATKGMEKAKKVYLQANVRKGKDIGFYFGKDKNRLQLLNDQPVDGSYLPPWDRAIRIGLISKGEKGKNAVFESFEIINNKE